MSVSLATFAFVIYGSIVLVAVAVAAVCCLRPSADALRVFSRANLQFGVAAE